MRSVRLAALRGLVAPCNAFSVITTAAQTKIGAMANVGLAISKASAGIICGHAPPPASALTPAEPPAACREQCAFTARSRHARRSPAMVADAVHSLSDLVADALTLLALQAARLPGALSWLNLARRPGLFARDRACCCNDAAVHA